MRVHVTNMQSAQGNTVPNQFVIRTDKGRYFQSYSTVIAFIPYDGGKTQLDRESWNYSRTTARYRNQFLDETTADTKRKIEDGTYELTDLN